MFSHALFSQFALAALLATYHVAASNFNISSGDIPPEDIIIRDVVILGGGSSGTFTAVRLTDFNQSVIIVEEKDRLGGHTMTVFDSASNKSTDIGVIIFQNIPIVLNYFKRFGIPVTAGPFPGFAPGQVNASFPTGEAVTNAQSDIDTAALEAAIGAYSQELLKFPFIFPGFVNLPDPVPEELLQPTLTFIQQKGLGALTNTLFGAAQGFANLLSQPVIYTMKVASLTLIQSLTAGVVTTANNDNSALYLAATKFLGASNILFNAKVVSAKRNSVSYFNNGKYGNTGSGVELVVATPSGFKLIRAKKLVIAAPPLLSNLQGFDLSTTEIKLFSQWTHSAYYTGLVANLGLNISSLNNLDPNQPFDFPLLPGPYQLQQSTIPGLANLKFASPVDIPNPAVEATILAEIALLQKGLGSAVFADTTAQPRIQNFSNHSPFGLQVSAEAIRKGFYRELNGLQGERNTFYTGAAFETHDSSLIWNFTETVVLPKIVSSLQHST